MAAELLTNDKSYQKWLNKNADGFLANVTSNLRKDYFVVHKSACHLITPGTSRNNAPGAFTERGYRKIVGSSPLDVFAWGLRQGFPPEAVHLCQLCLKGQTSPPAEQLALLIEMDGDPLVLTQQVRTAGGRHDGWKDVEGERYHFPNQYRNKVRTGRPFVYYRGTRRARGRGEPQYFGWGRIGEVYRDTTVPENAPKKDWKWFCDIEDYTPFGAPVHWKRDDGSNYEGIEHQNLWGVGVRETSAESFAEVLGLSGGAATSPTLLSIEPVEVVEDLLVAVKRRGSGPGRSGGGGRRRSRNAYKIGRDGERIVLDYLRGRADGEGMTAIRWVSDEGATPGWDIEFVDADGVLQSVEVKATTGPRFPSVELTVNEWSAAEKRRDCFWLVLVADVYGEPKMQWLQDPAALLEQGAVSLEPLLFRLELHEQL